MSLTALLRKMGKHITVSAIIFVLVALGFILTNISTTKTKYVTNSTLLFSVSLSNSFKSETNLDKFYKTYRTLVTDPLVLSKVGDSMNPKMSSTEFAGHITVTSPVNSPYITYYYVDTNKNRSNEVATKINAEIKKIVEQTSPVADQNYSPEFKLSDSSAVTRELNNSSLNKIIPKGIILGLALGIFYAAARALLNTKVSSLEDVDSISDYGIIGWVDNTADSSSSNWILLSRNMEFLNRPGEKPVTLITSSVDKEPVAEVAIAISKSLTTQRRKVILVDADMRARRASKLSNLTGAGLSELLSGQTKLSEIIQPTENDNLKIIPAGTPIPNAAELLSRPEFSELVKELSSQADRIIISTPPLLPASDAALAASSATTSLLVVNLGYPKQTEIEESLLLLESAKSRFGGFIITGKNPPKIKTEYDIQANSY